MEGHSVRGLQSETEDSRYMARRGEVVFIVSIKPGQKGRQIHANTLKMNETNL